MTIKQFIEKALEGGWQKGAVIDFFSTVSPWDGTTHFRRNGVQFSIHCNAILLDPLAWQAVGKVDGWLGRDVQVQRVRDMGEERASNAFPRFQKETHTEKRPSYKEQMHRMVDALAEGKSLEEFIETL